MKLTFSDQRNTPSRLALITSGQTSKLGVPAGEQSATPRY